MFSAGKFLFAKTASASFSAVIPSQLKDITSIELTNFWVGNDEAALLNENRPSRLSLQRNWDLWRTGPSFDYSPLIVYVNTQRPCTASLIAGQGSQENSMVSIVPNKLYTANRPFALKMAWAQIPPSQTTVRFRLRVSDDQNNSVEKAYTINLFDRSVLISCSCASISKNFAEAPTIFLKDSATNEILDPLLCSWSLVAGAGDTDNSKFSLGRTSGTMACSLSLSNPASVSVGQTLTARIRCALLTESMTETNVVFENAVTVTVDAAEASTRTPYSSQTGQALVEAIGYDTGGGYEMQYKVPITYDYRSNLYYLAQIKINNEGWKWIYAVNYNQESKYGIVMTLSPATYESVVRVPTGMVPPQGPIVVRHCDSVRFRGQWSLGLPWVVGDTSTPASAIIGDWMYSPTYQLLPTFGRSAADCSTPVIDKKVYSLFTSSE